MISVLPGRVRLKHPKLYRNRLLAKYLNVHLDHLCGVTYSKVNPYSASVLVYYDINKIDYSFLKDEIIKAITGGFDVDSAQLKKYDRYNLLIKKRDGAKNALFFYGLIYVILKVKHLIYGKHEASRNIKVLQAAALVAIIGGYPLLEGIYQRLTKKVPTNSDLLLRLIAIVLTITRESTDGIFVLLLKSYNDYLKFAAEVETQKLLTQTMKLTTGITKLPELVDKQDIFLEELEISRHVKKYSEQVTQTSIAMAAANYFFTGNLLNALAIMLILCPSGAGLAVSTGIQQYMSLLYKNKIFLRNPHTLEKTGKVNLVVLADVARAQTPIMISRLKKIGIDNDKIIMLTEDNKDEANETVAKLGLTKVYSNCNNDDKLKMIEQFVNSNTVMMVGDGTNDAPALRKADVSVSLVNSACDHVKLNSDCIIIDDEIYKLADLILLSQRSYKIIEQSVALAKYYNIFLGSLAFFQYFNPFTAKTLNTLNSLLVLVSNHRIANLKLINETKK